MAASSFAKSRRAVGLSLGRRRAWGGWGQPPFEVARELATLLQGGRNFPTHPTHTVGLRLQRARRGGIVGF